MLKYSSVRAGGQSSLPHRYVGYQRPQKSRVQKQRTEVGQEASSQFVKNLSTALAECGAIRKKHITLTNKMQRLLLERVRAVAEKNAYRPRIPLISQLSTEAGAAKRTA